MAKQMQKAKSPANPISEETPVKARPKKEEAPQSVRPNYVLCRSIIAGGLHITCKSGNTYYFKDYGTECEIEYYDLLALIRKHSEHIFLPRILIEDDSVLEEFPQIQKTYEDAYTREDIMEIIDLPLSQMQSALMSLPESTKDTVRSLVTTEIANGHIDSVKKIRFLSEYYDSDFNLISELFSK